MEYIENEKIQLILLTIKKMQKRMLDKEFESAEFNTIYTKLSEEFNDFFINYGSIFTKVIQGEDLSTIAGILFYRDKVLSGKMQECKVAELLKKKYMGN